MDPYLTFGSWLKQRRRAFDLTQAALAQRAGCATGTIRRMESDDLRPSRQIAERLADVLSIPDHARAGFVAFARDLPHADEWLLPPEPGPSPVASASTPSAPPRLPLPPTPLIGRMHTVSTACAVLLRPEVRLLTLTGPPGVGKTRLGLQIAVELTEHFVDGVWFVPLAPLDDPALVPAALARALELRADGQPIADALMARLHDRRLLLLLDNMEHVVEASPLIAQLLATAPRLKILCTSRVSLHLAGEHQFTVPPLALPDDNQLRATELLAHNPAVALFCARAQAVSSGFNLTELTAATVAKICRRLDGLPLAIELAAMRSKLLPPHALLGQLDLRLPLLTGGPRDAPARQQTVEAALAWSYDLLTATEQRIFTRLAVCAGGATLPLIVTICSDRHAPSGVGDLYATIDVLTSLVDHSLVQQAAGSDGEPRFSMLEIVREYALARLTERGELMELRRRHAQAYMTLAEAGALELQGAQQERWLVQLDAEYDNVHAALTWSLSSEAPPLTGLRIAAALWWFWWASGHVAEGRKWLRALLASTSDCTPPRAGALLGAGQLAYWAGDFAAARPLLDEAISCARRTNAPIVFAYARMLVGALRVLDGDPTGVTLVDESAMQLRLLGDTAAWYLGVTLLASALIMMKLGDIDQARRYGEDALAVFQRIGQPYGIAQALNYLGDVARIQGDRPRAASCYEQALPLLRQSGVKSDMPALLHNLGYIALGDGAVARAAALFSEALIRHRDIGNRAGVAECLRGLAAVAAAQERPLQAARLFGAVEALETRLSMPLLAPEQVEHDRYVAATRAQLPEQAWDAARATGRALSEEQAVAEALKESSASSEK